MLGSRLLFRGYGAARLAWPREAGLLALDTAVVVDEAHLARHLLTTTRRVARLATVAAEPVPVPAVQVVETTATPAAGGDSGVEAGAGGGFVDVGVEAGDLDDPVLDGRLCRPKPVRLLAVKDWPASTAQQRRRVAGHLAGAVVEILRPAADDGLAHTVGCFVNTVAMAVAVADDLRRQLVDGRHIRVVTVCGQARPADLDRLRAAHRGVLDIEGNQDVDVIVSTQS
jgi:CRISPR-associated endonuclease/helicase Cas3